MKAIDFDYLLQSIETARDVTKDAAESIKMEKLFWEIINDWNTVEDIDFDRVSIPIIEKLICNAEDYYNESFTTMISNHTKSMERCKRISKKRIL